MTHSQMINRGFKLIDFPIANQQYSFNDVLFIPKRLIWKYRSKQVSDMIYESGRKQGIIQGKAELKRTTTSDKNLRRFFR